MNTKKLLAGFIVALLLAVTSAAAACDVSCAFALASADCHSSSGASAGTSMSAADMSGMDMSDMATPDMTDRQMQASDSLISRAHSQHPSVSDMGPCERQSCDKGSFVFVKGRRSSAPGASSIFAQTAATVAGAPPQVFADARDDIPAVRALSANPTVLILRI